MTDATVNTQMELLQQHLGQLRRRTPARGRQPLYDENGKRQLVTELKPWHKMIVDMQIARPGITQRQLAEHFDVAENWLSILMQTDAFRAYSDERFAAYREELENRVIDRAINVTEKALERSKEKLDSDEKMTVSEIVNVGRFAASVTGLDKPKAIAPTQNNFMLIGAHPDALKEARARQAEIAAKNTEAYEHTDQAKRHVMDYEPDEVLADVEDAEVVPFLPGDN
jgi:hypothetical protein